MNIMCDMSIICMCQYRMADSEEESTNSESNWPMNEDWMIDILRGDNESQDKVTINVCKSTNDGYPCKLSMQTTVLSGFF